MALRTVVTYHLERPEGTPAETALAAVLEQVRLADQLGYDAAWFAEHHFGSHHSCMPTPLLLATYVAAQTQQIRVGTSVICLPLHHPVDVAEQVAVADVLTKGRLSIGFGSGSAPTDFAVFGSEQATRHARFEEQLNIVLRCWSGEPFTFQGQYYELERIVCVPRPVQAAAGLAWLAASSEPTAALAGKLGLGLQLPRGRPAAAYRPIVDAYRAAWSASGHPADAGQVSIARCLYVGESDEQALAVTASATRAFARRWSPTFDAALPPRELVDRLHFCVGGPDTVVRHLADLRETTGLSHLSIQPTWEDLPTAQGSASLQRFAALVRPRL